MKPIRTKILDNGVKLHTIGKQILKYKLGNSKSAKMVMCFERDNKLTFQKFGFHDGKTRGMKIITFSRVKGSLNVYFSNKSYNGKNNQSFCINTRPFIWDEFCSDLNNTTIKRIIRLLKGFGIKNGVNIKEEIYPAIKNFDYVKSTKQIPRYFTPYFKKEDFTPEKMRKLVLKKYRNDKTANDLYNAILEMDSEAKFINLAILAKIINTGVDLTQLFFKYNFLEKHYHIGTNKYIEKEIEDLIFGTSKLKKTMYGN